MEEAHRDIGNALMQLRVAYAKHRIPCPDVFEYSDPEKACDALVMLRGMVGPNFWVMDDKAARYGTVSICGFTMRFEPKHIEQPVTGLELYEGIFSRIFKDPN